MTTQKKPAAKPATKTTEEAVEQKKPAAKRLNYTGIKLIGSKWYSSKDKFTKGFATADECANYFNGERKDG